MSTSSFLYKGKGKLRTSPGSYRKLSIGSCINKIIDCYLADTIKLHIRENQSPLQYGFSQNIDFKQCAVLRETSVDLNTLNGKTTFITAADVSNAFTRTQRETQMYEMWRAGERLSVYSYSQASYHQTFTVLRNGNEYSEIICEECGSQQGGKNSAIEFVAYNSAWSRLIVASGIGIKICGECIGGFVCADDSLAAQAELAELIAMSLIYDYFS